MEALGSAIMVACVTLSSLSFYCVFGNIVTTANDDYSTIFYTGLCWYRKSPKVRRYLLMIMMSVQRPFYLSGYGIIRASMQNLMRVSDCDGFQWIYFNQNVFTGLKICYVVLLFSYITLDMLPSSPNKQDKL